MQALGGGWRNYQTQNGSLWWNYQPCDEITGPKKTSKKNKKEVNFWKLFWWKSPNKPCSWCLKVFIDRSFELRGEIRLIRSVMTNWRLGNFFLFHFKGTPSQDQQKTFRRRLITFKVTLTGQSHFMLIFVLRKVALRGHTDSVQWKYAIGPKNPLV